MKQNWHDIDNFKVLVNIHGFILNYSIPFSIIWKFYKLRALILCSPCFWFLASFYFFFSQNALMLLNFWNVFIYNSIYGQCFINVLCVPENFLYVFTPSVVSLYLFCNFWGAPYVFYILIHLCLYIFSTNFPSNSGCEFAYFLSYLLGFALYFEVIW